MSGGAFNHNEMYLLEIAETLEANQSRFSAETQQIFSELAKLSMEMHAMLKAADYLIECDDSEDNFLDKIKAVLL